MFIDAATEEILFLGRLISIKVDSRFLSKRILRSICLGYEYFSLIKKPVPQWQLINWSIQSDFAFTQAYNWKI